MKPSTKTALAGLLAAAGAVLSALATELRGSETTETPEPTVKRGRKSNSATPSAESTTAPAEVTITPEPTTTEPQGKTYEELKALIKPLVEGGKGEAVKAIIKKYSPTGMKDMEAKHHEAFEKELEELSY